MFYNLHSQQHFVNNFTLLHTDNIDARLFQMPFYQSDELLLLPLSVKFLRGLKLLYSVSGYTLCTTL